MVGARSGVLCALTKSRAAFRPHPIDTRVRFEQGAEMFAGGEGVSRAAAARSILDGPSLNPDSTGSLWSLRRAGDYGLTGPMLHRQSAMFLMYLRDRAPVKCARFLEAVQAERTFAKPFRDHFGGSVAALWRGFAASLRAERADGIDVHGAEQPD